MKFTFATRGSCCGAKQSIALRSTNYIIEPGFVSTSLIRAFDVFFTNYHTQPASIILTQQELQLVQAEMPNSEFSLKEGVLHYRNYLIVLE